MARTRRTADNADFDRRVGQEVARLREKHKWSATALARRLDMSVTHLTALEKGKHSFTAYLVVKLSEIFGEPLSELLRVPVFAPDVAADRSSILMDDFAWFFQALPDRDRAILVDLARKFLNLTNVVEFSTPRRSRESGLVVSLEGIDGVLLRGLADKTMEQLQRDAPVAFIGYDHGSELWRHMRSRFRSPRQVAALERTLLFACERLARQEDRIRPALRDNMVVFSPFFAMAPIIYQAVDGVSDRRLIEIIETLLVQPDVVVIVYSSPEDAAVHATQGLPGENEFYSPYCDMGEFEKALRLHENAREEFVSFGYTVYDVDLRGRPVSDGELTKHGIELSKKIRRLRKA